MDLRKIAGALAVLRNSDSIEKLGGGIISGAKSIYDAIARGAKQTGSELTELGHPLLGTAASLAPVAGLAYAGKRLYESQPIQTAIQNHRMRQYQKQMAQQGY